jgi:transcriptional regulator with GAF, ATPase, and Fis domain
MPLWMRHFVPSEAQRLRKRLDTSRADAVEALTRYHGPGNVRERQNVIERAVMLTPDTVLRLPPAKGQRSRSSPARPTSSRTLEEAECEHILQVLQETNWVSGGPQGPRRAWGYDARRYFIAWRSSVFHAGRRDYILTPVAYFRHCSPTRRSPRCPATSTSCL